MRYLPRGAAFSLVPLLTMTPFDPAAAQEPMSQVDDFDPARAILNDEPWFDPFRVEATEPLAAALDDGRVESDTPLLVLERHGTRLALLTMQMSYHHVAQGELAGEPWMVSF